MTICKKGKSCTLAVSTKVAFSRADVFFFRTHKGSFECSNSTFGACVPGIVSGLANLFVRHTSCGLLITENADPSVRRDLETLARRWVPDGDPAYEHDTEGDDDMAAHARTVLGGCSLSVPVGKGRLLLGTWQGIFLWEHRSQGHSREIVITLLG